jgi:hypothetical protein
MLHVRTLTVYAVVGSMMMLFSTVPALADHLDRLETRSIVRHLEEKNDVLQDRIADWVAQRPDEREHRAEAMLRNAEHFDQNLAQFKIDLYHHEEPWDLRDNARNIIDTAADFGHSIEQGEWHDQIRHEWEDMRDSANELARQFHLPEIGH